ncbi:MAG: DNA mismatch repair endonuclease MutL [Clostridiales bacterium]|nr:DNA mismatch repair endonuclease MutL [Clostridiales bacterium]
MSKILQLDPHVADLIAAGEVVERPASVIKELMENSIDAGASIITVEIKGGGMTYMRVSDNGSGIAPEDTETAFLRHATSKLRDERGLEAISTLGFRGEALAAVAAVSRIELLTREKDAAEGTSLLVEGGILKNKMIAGCPEGTTMIVRDLFYNTPARLKFMKTDRAEGASVSAQVVCCALSHPEVSVRYIKDGKEECHTPGDSRMDSCIYSIFGREFANNLLPARTSDDNVTAEGFVSAPAFARGNRSYQFFFVNGRYVKSKTLQAALEQAYKNTLFTGRFPSCVLYITLSPGQVDVNVHPTKTEVKFLNERQVFDSVYYAALSALEREGGGVEIKLSQGTRGMLHGSAPASHTAKHEADYVKSPKPYDIGGFSDRTPAKLESYSYGSIYDETKVNYKISADSKTPESGYTGQQLTEEDQQADILPAEVTHRFVGEALNTYILVEKGDSLWLIDKHAAHERINFDRLKNRKQVTMSQTLAPPVIVNPGQEDTALLADNAGIFEKLGFYVEVFGESSIAVRGIPVDIDIGDVESVLGEMTRILRRGGTPDEGLILDELLHTIACKAAIKAGRRSEPPELEALIERVLSGEIRYCPHGRPVAIELTKAELDRNFKRT